MNHDFKPMLASEANLPKLTFPLIVSPKLDGIRAVVRNGVVLSRSLKPIPNLHVQELFGRSEYEGFDGELIVGSPVAPDVFHVTSGAVRRRDGKPFVRFFVFDILEAGGAPYSHRRAYLEHAFLGLSYRPVELVSEFQVSSLDGLEVVEEECLKSGYEGVMLRSPDGPYKFGRSTACEGYLLKLKRFKDSEARIIAVEELMHNENEATVNELGRTERSSHKENLVPAGTMGKLYVQDIHTGQRFRIGTGFTAEQREWFWHRNVLNIAAGLIVRYKFFPVGVKDLPRHPSYLGLRDAFDLS